MIGPITRRCMTMASGRTRPEEKEGGRTVAERLQKLMARSGICSRRTAEELLRQGRVRVNGQTAALGESADPALDRVEVDGRPLPSAPLENGTWERIINAARSHAIRRGYCFSE